MDRFRLRHPAKQPVWTNYSDSYVVSPSPTSGSISHEADLQEEAQLKKYVCLSNSDPSTSFVHSDFSSSSSTSRPLVDQLSPIDHYFTSFVKQDFSMLAAILSPSFELQVFGGIKEEGLFYGRYWGFSEVCSQIQCIYEHLNPQSFEVYDQIQIAPGKLLCYVFLSAYFKSDLNKSFLIHDGFPCIITYEMKPFPNIWTASVDRLLAPSISPSSHSSSSSSSMISSLFPSTLSSPQSGSISDLPMRYDFAITMCQEWLSKDRVYCYGRMRQLYIPRRKRRLSITQEDEVPKPPTKKRLLLLSSAVSNLSSSSPTISFSSSSSSSSPSSSSSGITTQYCESI